MKKLLLNLALTIAIILSSFLSSASTRLAADVSGWKFPLPAGTWTITQEPQAAYPNGTCFSHCANDTNWWINSGAIDIAPNSSSNIYVLAVADGVVKFSQDTPSTSGNVVKILHDNGLYSIYLHLQSRSVTVGQTVKQGDPIGIMGDTGSGRTLKPDGTPFKFGRHLHFSVNDGLRGNPVSLVGLDGYQYGTRSIVSSNAAAPGTTLPPPIPINSLERSMTTSFYSKIPLRNIWVESGSQFTLYIDGQQIMSESRPDSWRSYSKERVWLSPFINHSVEIKWIDKGADREPQFDQTWWPNKFVSGAELDPEIPLVATYSYDSAIDPVALGESFDLAVTAVIESPFTITSIDVLAGESKIASISGTQGTTSIPTDELPVGDVQLRLVAVVDGWEGKVTDSTFTIQVMDNPDFTGDLQPPRLWSPSNAIIYPKDTSITLDWNEAEGAAEYKVEVWGGTYSLMTSCDWQAGTDCPIGTMWPGTMSWHVKARTENGQESEWSETWTFTILDGAVTPPPQTCSLVIEDLSLSPSSATVGSNVVIRARSSWSDCFRSMRIKIDGNVVYELGSPEMNWTWNTSGYSTGTHTIRVEVAAKDDNSWSNAISRETSINLQAGTPPTATPCQAPPIEDLTVSPGSGSIGTSFNIYARATWNSCFRSMRVKVDGNVVYELSTPEFNWSWNSTGYGSGNHTIRLEVAAQGDNSWSNPSVRTTTINLTTGSSSSLSKPGLSSPSNGALFPPGTNITLQWNSVSGATQYLVEVWGGSFGGSHRTACNWQSNTSCNLGSIAPGNVMWRVKARNSSGNESPWSDEWNFTPQ